MESFISRQELTKQKKRARAGAWIFRAAAAGTLVFFIVLCLVIRTANARTVTRTMLAGTTLLGWLCIGLYMLRVRPDRARAQHTEMLLEGKAEDYEGILRLADRTVQVPKSILIRRVTLEGETPANPTEEPEKKRLNLDEHLAGRMPPEGSRVRVRAVNDYITGLETICAAEAAPRKPGTGAADRIRRAGRRAAALVIPFVLWAMGVVIIGGFIFTRITDTDPKHKIVIYADCDLRDGAGLADLLEQRLEDPVRKVQVRPFTYDLFGSSEIEKADLYIVSAEKAAGLRDWFAPLPEELRNREDLLTLRGEPCGIPVFGPGAETAAGAYLDYEPRKTYYLFFSAASLHYSANGDAEDNRAAEAAAALLEIP